MITAVLEAVHTAALASWFGCMCYSVMFVQRHPMRAREPAVWEVFVTEMVHGVRWIVLGTMAVIFPTWVALIALRIATADTGTVWLSLMATKSVLLIGVVLLFVYVSWHLWPLRIFALPEELPPIDRKFMNASQGLVLTLGGALALGVVAGHV
ncbi:hypothetical protein [Actinophytocola glycyrrhizae]|uniref:Copper resistance protein D domain-containing protein n=1 Tax=Actinophytocola glycyrrhizae TaxID=2044873 RepID=A0ABV9SA45_9PSEU